MKILINILFVILIINNIKAQSDTLLLMSGKQIPVKNYKQLPNNMYVFNTILPSGEIKEKEFYPVEIFSLKKINGEEIIFFKEFEDEKSGLNFTKDNTKKYIAGEKYARKHYKFILGKITSFLIGLTSPVISGWISGSLLFAPILPIGFSLMMTYIPPSANKVKKITNNKYFLEGYKVAGQPIRSFNSFKYGFTGLIIGIPSYIIISKLKSL